MEFPPHFNSEWAGWERGHSGNVSGAFVEICGAVQMPVRRWAESVPRAIENHRAEGCVQNLPFAGSPCFRQRRFFPFLPPAARATFRINKYKQGWFPAVIPVQNLEQTDSFAMAD